MSKLMEPMHHTLPFPFIPIWLPHCSALSLTRMKKRVDFVKITIPFNEILNDILCKLNSNMSFIACPIQLQWEKQF
jgi:hypothetical protein